MIDYKQKYYKYKYKYINLIQAGGKQSNHTETVGKGSNHTETVGKGSNHTQAVENLDSKDSEEYVKIKKEIVLNKVEKITPICQIRITGELVIGDIDFTPVPGMKKGIYNAYMADDNLIVVHESYQPKFDINHLHSLKLKISDASVGVDTGRFGFYDYGALLELTENNEGPYALIENYENDYYCVTMKEYILCNKKNDYLKKKINEDELIKKYSNNIGVVSSTGTGDGFFDCYVYENNIAVLVGGRTFCKIYSEPKNETK